MYGIFLKNNRMMGQGVIFKNGAIFCKDCNVKVE
jgi:hypothetical protein